MKSIEERVTKILKEVPSTRDDDMKLYALVLRRFYIPNIIQEMSALDLLNSIWKSKVPHFTSILRCRQLLQQHNEELRGDQYSERQKKSKEIKSEIINWKPGQADLFTK